MFGALETERSLHTQRVPQRNAKGSVSPSKYTSIMGDLTQNDLVSMKTCYVEPKTYKRSPRIDVLAMPKPQYHGKDFFQRHEFRGLFLADHQEAIGERAFKCVDSLNQETVSKFNDITTFKDSISQKKAI